MKSDVFQRKIRIFLKYCGELPVRRVWFHSPCKLDQDSGFFIFDHEVHRQERSKGVIERLGEVDPSGKCVREQWRGHFDRAQLRRGWAPLSRFREPDWLASDPTQQTYLGRVTGLTSVCCGGIQAHARRERHFDVFESREGGMFKSFLLFLV
jgi:hypothetical protein